MKSKEELKKEMVSDYPLIRMADIEDEARELAVAWHENATNWIGDKHKLASDIMNYHRRKSAPLKQRIAELEKEVERLNKVASEAFDDGWSCGANSINPAL